MFLKSDKSDIGKACLWFNNIVTTVVAAKGILARI
jgi:hypothetical protein